MCGGGLGCGGVGGGAKGDPKRGRRWCGVSLGRWRSEAGAFCEEQTAVTAAEGKAQVCLEGGEEWVGRQGWDIGGAGGWGRG